MQDDIIMLPLHVVCVCVYVCVCACFSLVLKCDFCARSCVLLVRSCVCNMWVFYGGRALKVCKFSSRLHDIMTDELIISKFHWMSHMGAETCWNSHSEGGTVRYIWCGFKKINKRNSLLN